MIKLSCLKTNLSTWRSYIMTILSQKQLSLAEIYSDCTHFFESDKHHFLSLLEENLNLHALIHKFFYQHYYRAHGRHRDFDLCSILWALILRRIFHPHGYTSWLRFSSFPENSAIFAVLTGYPMRLADPFQKHTCWTYNALSSSCWCDWADPQKIDADKAMMTIFDTSGIEAYVTENNPKFANKIIKQLKAFKSTSLMTPMILRRLTRLNAHAREIQSGNQTALH